MNWKQTTGVIQRSGRHMTCTFDKKSLSINRQCPITGVAIIPKWLDLGPQCLAQVYILTNRIESVNFRHIDNVMNFRFKRHFRNVKWC